MSSVLNSPSHKFLSFSQTRNICLMILVRHALLVINLRERNRERQRWMKRGSKKRRVAVVTSALLGFKKALFIFGDQSRILRRQWFSFRVSWFIVCWSKLHLAIHDRLNTGESSMTNTEPQEISYNQARYWFKHSVPFVSYFTFKYCRKLQMWFLTWCEQRYCTGWLVIFTSVLGWHNKT